MNEKILILARKLKSLSDRGVGGEKQNAITMLESLMKKHGITVDVINENDAKDHEFIIPDDRMDIKFFIQVMANVMGGNVDWGSYKKAPRGKKRYYIKCTPSEAIEIQAKFNFFNEIWESELEIFYSAFIQKNHLYRKSSKDDKGGDKELTPEERNKLMKMMHMMSGMERHIFTKQIGYKQNHNPKK